MESKSTEVRRHRELPSVPYALLDNLREGIVIIDEEGHLLYANVQACRILDIQEIQDNLASASEKSIFAKLSPTSLCVTRSSSSSRSHHDMPRVALTLCINGTWNEPVATASTHLLCNDRGESIGTWITLKRDLQGGPSVKQVRTKSDSTETVTFVVHDLKGPLSGILTSVEQLLASTPDTGETFEGLSDIRDAAKRMYRMVIDLLDTHMGEEGKLQPRLEAISLTNLFEKLVATMEARAKFKHQTLEFIPPKPDILLLADQQLTFRILQNLVDNCFKYGARGGIIRANVSIFTSSVRIRIQDRAPVSSSFPKEINPTQYSRTEIGTGERDSQGIGLRFCRVAAEVHHGKFWVDSNPEGETCFCLELPMVEAQPSYLSRSIL